MLSLAQTTKIKKKKERGCQWELKEATKEQRNEGKKEGREGKQVEEERKRRNNFGSELQLYSLPWTLDKNIEIESTNSLISFAP